MGPSLAEISLRNPVDPSLASMKVTALADTGALHLCIPEHMALQLKLPEIERREATIPDGSRRLIPYVGPVEVAFQGRHCFVGAMVIGNEALLGAIPMEDLDLVVQPGSRTVTVNPNSPNIPSSVVK